MQIIDINCAIGEPMRSQRYSTAEGLLQWLDKYHIHCALAYHSEAMREPEMGNRLMVEAAAKSHGRLKLCLALNPSLQSLGIPGEGTPLERLKKLRPSAVRIFPGEQLYPFDPFYAEEILQVCQQLRLPLIVDCPYDTLFMTNLPRVCEAYPDVPIILLRFMYNRSRLYMPILRKLPNVYLDMSNNVDVGAMEEVVERFGSCNLLFGSGLPTYEPSGGLGLLHYAQLSDAHKENIASGNFLRLEGGIRYDD